MTLQERTPDPGGAAPAQGTARALRYELSRPDRLYLARRRLLQAGYTAVVRGPVPGSRTVVVLEVAPPSTRADLDRVARIGRGTDPTARRV
jgi:hypothetical protein